MYSARVADRVSYHLQKTGLHVPLGFLSPETFPLPALGPCIREIAANDIYSGRGFAVLRGIPVDGYTDLENTIIHAGVASWLGRLRGLQDEARGGSCVVRHIKDVTAAAPHLAIGTAQFTGTVAALILLDAVRFLRYQCRC